MANKDTRDAKVDPQASEGVQVQITMADVQVVLNAVPLFAEQVKNVALNRALVEANARLEASKE